MTTYLGWSDPESAGVSLLAVFVAFAGAGVSVSLPKTYLVHNIRLSD